MAVQQLTAALNSLSKSVSNFNIGAVSIEDFKRPEERLSDMREILKVQKAHSFLISAKQNSHLAEKSQENIDATVSILHEKNAQLQITNKAINACLQSCASNDVMYDGKPTPDTKKQVQSCMKKLFVLNDKLLSLHTSMIEALEIEKRLKIKGPKSLLEYKVFLKEQEDLRDKKLDETNPQILKNKKKLESKLMKINVMKRLMTNMIGAAGNTIIEEPFLFEMMKKHRELINIETIIEMGRDTAPSDTS